MEDMLGEERGVGLVVEADAALLAGIVVGFPVGVVLVRPRPNFLAASMTVAAAPSDVRGFAAAVTLGDDLDPVDPVGDTTGRVAVEVVGFEAEGASEARRVGGGGGPVLTDMAGLVAIPDAEAVFLIPVAVVGLLATREVLAVVGFTVPVPEATFLTTGEDGPFGFATVGLAGEFGADA